jgi:hypothetical protein
MAFANGKPRPANSGRKKGARNKRSLAGAPNTYPDALEHLAKVMTSADGTVTPDLKLRAAVALAQYQHSKPTPARCGTLIDPIPYTAPKTVEEARSLILELGERLAKGEIPVEQHDALVAGIRAYFGDKAAEQQKILDDLAYSRRRRRFMSFATLAKRLMSISAEI